MVRILFGETLEKVFRFIIILARKLKLRCFEETFGILYICSNRSILSFEDLPSNCSITRTLYFATILLLIFRFKFVHDELEKDCDKMKRLIFSYKEWFKKNE